MRRGSTDWTCRVTPGGDLGSWQFMAARIRLGWSGSIGVLAAEVVRLLHPVLHPHAGGVEGREVAGALDQGVEIAVGDLDHPGAGRAFAGRQSRVPARLHRRVLAARARPPGPARDQSFGLDDLVVHHLQAQELEARRVPLLDGPEQGDLAGGRIGDDMAIGADAGQGLPQTAVERQFDRVLGVAVAPLGQGRVVRQMADLAGQIAVDHGGQARLVAGGIGDRLGDHGRRPQPPPAMAASTSARPARKPWRQSISLA